MAAWRRSSAWWTSVMFPGTLAFSRFDYPSRLPQGVQARMAEIATTLMQGLGFDNGMFNIEMMYDAEADRISIIEINPRMASQFADLYEKVDGTISYSVLLDIAQGRPPRFTRRQGRYAFAASCVLRSFEDYLVAAVPSEADIGRLARIYPDIRVELHATPGRKLVRRISGWKELSLRRRQSRRPRPRRRAQAIRVMPDAAGPPTGSENPMA